MLMEKHEELARRIAQITAAKKRRRQEGMTLVEIMIVVVIMAMIATAVGFAVVPQLEKTKVKTTTTDAAKISQAVEMYLMEHNDCPTTQDLVDDRILKANASTTDAWGEEFQIECEGDMISVVSAGSDNQFGTDDDIAR